MSIVQVRKLQMSMGNCNNAEVIATYRDLLEKADALIRQHDPANNLIKEIAEAFDSFDSTAKNREEEIPLSVLRAISNSGLTLVKTQHSYQLIKLGPAVAHAEYAEMARAPTLPVEAKVDMLIERANIQFDEITKLRERLTALEMEQVT